MKEGNCDIDNATPHKNMLINMRAGHPPTLVVVVGVRRVVVAVHPGSGEAS